MSFQDSHLYFWCTFQAYDSNSIKIEWIMLSFQILLFLVIIKAYIQAKKQNHFNHLSTIYRLIISWLICFFLKTLVNIVAYYCFISQSPLNAQNKNSQSDNIDFDALRALAGIFLFLDVITTFFLQHTMIFIPYKWMKNGLQLLTDESFVVQERIKINRVSKFLQLTKKYLFIRNIYLLYAVAVSITVIVTDQLKSLGKYKLIPVYIDSTVIILVYLTGFATLKMINEKLQFKKRQLRSMLIEYIILFSINIFRIIINTLLNFIGVVSYNPDKYCYDGEDSLLNCFFEFIGLTLMHATPGAIILYVYWPPKEEKLEEQIKKSLLISSSEKGYS